MKEKRTYIQCARLVPYLRQCSGCKHAKSCSLYYENEIDWNTEAAKEDYQVEQKELVKEAIR